eukprot:1912908-Prymnesium_polylepis.2
MMRDPLAEVAPLVAQRKERAGGDVQSHTRVTVRVSWRRIVLRRPSVSRTQPVLCADWMQLLLNFLSAKASLPLGIVMSLCSAGAPSCNWMGDLTACFFRRIAVLATCSNPSNTTQQRPTWPILTVPPTTSTARASAAEPPVTRHDADSTVLPHVGEGAARSGSPFGIAVQTGLRLPWVSCPPFC